MIRPEAVAGQFYPADADILRRDVLSFMDGPEGDLETGSPRLKALPKALIGPHAGYVYSGGIAGTAHHLWKPAKGKIKRIVMLGPSHRVAIRGIATTAADHWRTPLGEIAIDREAIERALKFPSVRIEDRAHDQEHGLEVHLPFLQEALGDFQLVPFVTGMAETGEVSQLLDELWGGPETGIVISTDLSHYLDYETATALDGKTAKAVEAFDWLSIGREQACGRIAMNGLIHTGRRRGLRIARTGLCNSGDTAGTKDRVVGYGAWALYEPDESEETNKEATFVHPDEELPDEELIANYGQNLLQLARQALDIAVRKKGTPQVNKDRLPPDLSQKRAVFVTLEKGGRLRGCIGSLEAHRPLVDDICMNTYGAALRDNRFPPVAPQELRDIQLSLSLLSQPEPMEFTDEADLLARLRPGEDGLIITDQGHRATYLPMVWEQIPEPAQFLNSLKRKAGLPENHWSDSFKVWRYGATKLS